MVSRLAVAVLAGISSIAAIAWPVSGAAAKDTVKIAFVGPLTGGSSATGLGGRNSALLAVQQRNADPKAKYSYDLVVMDDECKPNVGIQVATKIAADDSIIAGITHYCSAVGIATVDVYHRFQLPIVVWGAVLPEITYGNNYPEIHRVNGTMIDEARLAAQFLADNKFKRVAILHDTTDYGKGQNKYFSKFLTESGGQIVGTFPVAPDQQDFTAELTKIKELNPEVVYWGGLTPGGVRIRTQMDRVGLRAQFIGVSGILNAGYLEGASTLAEGTVSFHNGAPIAKYKEGQAFLDAYKKAGFREDPDAYGPFAYTATNLVMDAIEKVGPDRDKVRDTLNHTKNYQGLVGTINFDDHRQNLVNPYVYVVEGGKWTYWPDSSYSQGKKSLVRASN